MDQNKRLIVLIHNSQYEYDGSKPWHEQCADYLLAKGVIVPPCKVGDTVYMPWEYKGVSGVAILTVTHIIIDDVHSYIRTDFDSDCEEYKQKYNYGRLDFREFGEKVFTSKKEAAEALEKLIEGCI